ncbi:hypothetical protein HDU87_006124 [Geranomyces variabilis]|uniref:Uncharacterized protein n=1 Tax=Geranomyces variabilis TaxID=109894 RepID=A0AAD5XKR7_9FUNG|nr:hypothetical protein HDU87_006124 [Geranomyces variabilis]
MNGDNRSPPPQSFSPPPQSRRLLAPPSPVAPRSSSLPPPNHSRRPRPRQTAQVDHDDNVEATFDFMAKVPSLSMFGFGLGNQAAASADSTSDEDFDEQHEMVDFKSRNETHDVAVAADAKVEDNSDASPRGWTVWGGAFGLNFPTMPAMPVMSTLPAMPTMPAMPAIPALPTLLPSMFSKASSAAPAETDPQQNHDRDPSPDASAGTAAASAWKKAWSSLTSLNTRHLRPCGHRHPFHFLEGDLVLLGGMYGSFLADKKTGQTAWLTTDHLFGFTSVDVGLSLDDVDDRLVPAGVLDRIGPINICADLVREFTAQAACSDGKFRFSPFGYDWRRDPEHSAKALEAHLEEIYTRNGGRPITVVAHSMGGLITLAVVNRRPDLVRGVVFVGTPFGGVPCILWQLRRGIPFFFNKGLMSADLHFAARSSFVFLPMDGRALVVDAKQNGVAPAPAVPDDASNASGEEDYLIDFYSADEWIHHTLSQTLHRAAKSSAAALDAHKQYLQRTLHAAKAFRQSLAFDPEKKKKYPPLTHLVSTAWPTPTRIKCTTTTPPSPPKPAAAGDATAATATATTSDATSPAVVPHVETKFLWPTRFKDGDGIVTRDSMTLPPGFDVSYLDTAIGHWGSMNDLGGIRSCLKKIVTHERKGKPGAPLPAARKDSAISDPKLLRDDFVFEHAPQDKGSDPLGAVQALL